MRILLKLGMLALVIILLITSMSVLLTSCNTPKYYATLEQAYAEGKISRQDLMSIAYYHSKNHNEFDENFVPTPMNPKEIDEKTRDKIIKIFEERENKTIASFSLKRVFEYLGTYNNLIVCAIRYFYVAQEMWETEIDGITLFSQGGTMFIAIELW